MDISFRLEDRRFNYRVSAMLLSGTRILAMHDERSPYFYLPGGRVKLGETAEQAVVRELEEALGVTLKIARPLWLNQAFFTEDVDGFRYHELCIYFLMDLSDTDLLERGDCFTLTEGKEMTRENHAELIRWCVLGAVGGVLMAAIYEKRCLSHA